MRKSKRPTRRPKPQTRSSTRTFKAGNDALKAKNYDLAIAQYDEGLTADPEHPGAPALLTNKTMALNRRAVERYNAAVKNPDDAAKDIRHGVSQEGLASGGGIQFQGRNHVKGHARCRPIRKSRPAYQNKSLLCADGQSRGNAAVCHKSRSEQGR